MLNFHQAKVHLTEMQKLALLHFQQQNIPFYKQLILYDHPEEKQEYLLLEEIGTNQSLLYLINQLKEKESKQYYPFCLCLLYCLNQQIHFLEEHFLSVNLNLLQAELLEVNPDFAGKLLLNPADLLRVADLELCLKMLYWYILPKEIELNPNEIIMSPEDIWQSLSQLDPAHHELYQEHRQFIMDGKWQQAHQFLLPHITKFKENIKEKTSSNQNKKRKVISLKSKISFWEKLKNFKIDKKIEPEEKTIPLNPREELFRLAMISEGVPGTVEENEGLRAFILIDEFLIGRDKKICDLYLPPKTVGRIHARISRHGSHYFIEDLGSANGTYLDEKKLNKHQTYLLPDYCRLKFAELAFYFIVD